MRRLSRRLQLAVVFAAVGLAFWRVGGRWWRAAEASDVVVLRLAHMSLDPPVHAAFERLAARFEAAHPGVRIEQMPVPMQLYRAWFTTQMIGGSPPDIVEVPPWTLADDVLPYIEELSEPLRRPNPANAGTALADTPWHDTFINGMNEQPNFYEQLLGYYSVPMSVITIRIVYNRHLLEDVYGFEHPPRTVAELARQCEAIRARQPAGGPKVLPLIAAGWKAHALLQGVARSCTAGVARELDPLANGWNWDDEMSVAFLRGRWSLDTPEVRSALAQMRLAGRHLPPGFMQLTDGDAVFPFIQGQAVFYVALSGEFTTLLSQCDFPLGVARFPVADTPEARPLAEGNLISMASLGIPRHTPHRELALEFLQFATSQAGNGEFSALSHWLPAVRGLPIEPKLAGFAAETRGDPPGFSPWLFSDPNLTPMLDQNEYRLMEPRGSVDAFVDAVRPSFRPLLHGALARYARRSSQLLQRLDIALAARDRLDAAGATEVRDLRDPAHLLEVEVISTIRTAYLRQVLAETPAKDP